MEENKKSLYQTLDKTIKYLLKYHSYLIEITKDDKTNAVAISLKNQLSDNIKKLRKTIGFMYYHNFDIKI